MAICSLVGTNASEKPTAT